MQSEALDHRRFVRSLNREQRAALTRRSDRAGALHLAGHWGLVVLFGALIWARVPYWPLLLLPQGILIVFLFSLLHETSHRTVFATGWCNRVVAAVCGLLIAVPPEWFRHFHLAHHRHTQDPERDPELRHPKPTTLRDYLVHVSGLPVWRQQLLTLLRNAGGACDDDFVPAGARPGMRNEAVAMIAVYALAATASLATGSAALLLVWIVPAILGQPFLRLYLLAEHGRCPLVANMFENSRTTFTNGLVRWLAWNMPYHAEHHALPNVPFHQLPRFHGLVRARLRETERGYSRFHRKFVGELRHEGREAAQAPRASG